MIQMLRDIGAPEAAETDEAMAWMGMPTTHDAMPGMATEDAARRARRVERRRRRPAVRRADGRPPPGRIHMAEYAAAEAENAEVRSLADSIVDGQQGEIVELEDRSRLADVPLAGGRAPRKHRV